MSTLVCFHAHPDDDSIATAGTMAKAKAAGHRVVLVVATRGEQGEPVPGVLAEGEQLALRRTAETWAGAEVLDVDRVEFLGYVDSGMADTPTSRDPWAFCNADVEHAAARLALILREERADVLTVYDDHGVYGHPDHIQVHRVGHRAAAKAGVQQVYESTFNRSEIDRLEAEVRGAASTGGRPNEEGSDPAAEPTTVIGKPEHLITHCVDVSRWLETKRAVMRTHRSQMGDDHFLLAMPEEAFARAMGTEWYITADPSPPGSLAADLFRPFVSTTASPAR